jgi:DNA polymerase III alpha subunit
MPVDRKRLDLFLTESDVMQVFASTHIMAPFREDLEKCGFIKSTSLKWKADGSVIKTAGRVIIIHTPPTKSGKRVIFLTLEDEEGLFDLTVFEDVQVQYAKKILASAVLLVEGVLNRFGLRGVSIVARRFWTLKEFYERASNDRAKILSPALSSRPSPKRSLRQSAPIGAYNHFQYPEERKGRLSKVNPPLKDSPQKLLGPVSSVRDKNERIRYGKDKGGYGLLDRQNLDCKRHLLPEASNYRGRPA